MDYPSIPLESLPPGPLASVSWRRCWRTGKGDYSTYTTRAASGTVLASIQQPGADSGGVITNIAPGQYQYVFHTKAPSGYDATATHTIGIYGSRNLTVYSLGTNYASTTYNFVPNGAPLTHINDVIKTVSCNACHDQLSAHGGSRRGLDMCVLCHNPQNLDPNTGASMDAKVFFHKIHMVASLPSVLAGTPYVPAVNSFGSFDYSKVVYPADPGDPRRCTTCHSQSTGATQATAYLTKPTRASCGSCHDDVNFATGVNHPGGPQFDDNECATCHIPQGEIEPRCVDHGRAHGAHGIQSAVRARGQHYQRAELDGRKCSSRVLYRVECKRRAHPARPVRIDFVHHGGANHRLRLHQFWKRRYDARLCDGKRG